MQMRIAEAGGELASARRLIEHNGRLLDAALAENDPPLGLVERVELRWNAAYAVELCRRASERIFAAAGAHAVYDGHPLQRLHRDINTACHHAIVDFDTVAEIKGQMELGLEREIGLV
jgi:3-hydroxy-9,10-secoandrosta-1,3,5(10)-triene-9,17-dione monooxygenase